ncbi:TatD family hydrolase [Candidatus Nitrososphaera evergladensis]|uniref:TatD family hydrolase n=1 Tax=Candidatus Nitrososphaera evergladensis TaxID=1459637 RepID=UPI001D03F6D0|nr:TatD family hydrolase [Candidatus Nitrososphaera evergladensis]
MLLYDAHVHLTDSEYSGYLDHVFSSLYAMRIVACSVAVDLETTKKSLRLFKDRKDVIKQFVGIHPEFAAREDLDKFVQVARDNMASIDGIGEIGLDGTYEAERGVPYERQKQVFHAMLALAESEGKPVSIHSRRALDDILAILPSFRLRGALLHWFAGSKKQLARSMDMGLYVSYGPALVYSDDKKVLLKHTRRDRFLVETDGPVRYSRCFEGKPALPTSFLPSVVASAAAVLGVSYGEAAETTARNTEAFLGSQQL